MSEQTDQSTDTKWVVCVVVLAERYPRKKFANYYLGVKGDKAAAHIMQDQIAKRGFKADGRRFFADEIETLSVKQVEENSDEQ